MAGKSTGQILGTVVGAAVGFFIPGSYVALGASLGGMVGGLLDPPKGADTFGPRLDDLSVQTSTYGAPIGRAYGTVMASGNLYWLEGDALREHTKTESQGGKGGGGAEYTSYSYTATFAVGLMKVSDPTQTVALRRLWVGDILIYDAGSDNIESIVASNGTTAGFTFYNGSDDQPANPRMQADKGAANVSAYPGLVHIDFDDLDLAPYSNTLLRAQVRAELVVGDAVPQYDFAETIYAGGDEVTHGTASILFDNAGARYARIEWDNWSGNPVAVHFHDLKFSDYHVETAVVAATDIEGGVKAYYPVTCTDCDEPVAVVMEVPPSPYNTTVDIFMWTAGGQFHGETIDQADLPIAMLYFCCYRGGRLYLFSGSYSTPVKLSDGNRILATSPASYRSKAGGLSDNYLFLVAYSTGSTTTTIYRLNRDDLTLDATWTGAADPYQAEIYVADDNTVYTAARGVVYRWIGGQVESLGALVPSYFTSGSGLGKAFFRVFTDNPPLLYGWADHGDYDYRFLVGHAVVPQATASLRDIVTAECGLVGIGPGDIDLDDLTDSAVRGFKVVNPGSVRAPLEQLQAAFPFDVAQSGYAIRFVSRGGASVASIQEADIGAVAAGEQRPPLLPVTREMDSQIAARVTVRHLDPAREYDVGEQYAERPATSSVAERSVDLAIVLTSAEAAQIADVLNQKDWLERRDFGHFTLPPTYNHLDPADVVTLAHRGQSHTLRLTRIEYLPDGRLSCMARQTAAACYTSTATGEDPITVGQSLVPLRGSTAGYLFDIPRIRSEQDVPGMVFGLLGRASGWPGGALLRSDDAGNTWTAVGTMNERARVFEAGAALSANSGYSVDFSAVLDVTPITPGAELYGVSEAELYAHSNLAAYGSDGRWEIVAFQTVVDNTGSYTLRDFRRGLYGSEWASGLHATGDLLVMLDTTTVGFFGLPTTAIGSERLYRAVTQGAALDSAANVSDTYEAHNLKPLSPAGMNGDRHPVSRDWTLKPARRTRWPVELFSGQAVPLGETSESYEVEIWDATYATLKRTLTGTTAEIPYTLAQQTADFGAEQSTLYYRAYQMSSVVGRGLPLQGSITRLALLDPYADNVVFLRHMDTTGLVDVNGHAVTLNGNAARSATQAKFGGYAAAFDGTGDSLSMASSSDFDVFGGDFTYEFWFYATSNTPNQSLAQWYKDASNRANISIVSGTVVYYTSTTAGGGATRISLTAPTANAWHYCVLKKSGSTITLQVDTTTGTTTSNVYPTGPLSFHTGAESGGANCLTGYIDEDRLTRNVARDTSVVPTAAFPDI